MNAIIDWIKANRVPAGSILVLCGVGLAGSLEATQAWTASHIGMVTAITTVFGVAGALWKTTYGKK